MAKEMIVLIGNIGSGKSTLVKQYIEKGYIAIARDYLRYAIGEGKYIFDEKYEPVIWKTEQYMLRKFMELGIDKIVIDEVGVSRNMRKFYIKLAKLFGYKITALVMPRLSMKESVNRRMQNPHGQYSKKLWQQIWSQFDSLYEEPTEKEGFNKIIILIEERDTI